jgi:hypothetical protein
MDEFIRTSSTRFGRCRRSSRLFALKRFVSSMAYPRRANSLGFCNGDGPGCPLGPDACHPPSGTRVVVRVGSSPKPGRSLYQPSVSLVLAGVLAPGPRLHWLPGSAPDAPHTGRASAADTRVNGLRNVVSSRQRPALRVAGPSAFCGTALGPVRSTRTPNRSVLRGFS